jgi:hypothetical protein
MSHMERAQKSAVAAMDEAQLQLEDQSRLLAVTCDDSDEADTVERLPSKDNEPEAIEDASLALPPDRVEELRALQQATCVPPAAAAPSLTCGTASVTLKTQRRCLSTSTTTLHPTTRQRHRCMARARAWSKPSQLTCTTSSSMYALCKSGSRPVPLVRAIHELLNSLAVPAGKPPRRLGDGWCASEVW